MGMDGRLYAVGYYQKGLEKALEMDAHDDTPEGTPVLQVVAVCSGSTATRELLDALGRSNFRVVDMFFRPEEILARMPQLQDPELQFRAIEMDLDQIETLAKAGFHFHYDSN